MPCVSKLRKLYRASNCNYAICFCYEGKTMKSHQDMNANIVYEAIHSGLSAPCCSVHFQIMLTTQLCKQ